MVIKDLPDYEKRIIIVMPAGSWPAIVQVDLEQVLGDAACKLPELILLDKINPLTGGQQLINPSFETGDFIGWTRGGGSYEFIKTDNPRTGIYSAELKGGPPNGKLKQTFTTAIPVSQITALGYYSSQPCKSGYTFNMYWHDVTTYDDGTTTANDHSIVTPSQDGFTPYVYFDVKATLTSGKKVKSFEIIYDGITEPPYSQDGTYIDDVILTTTNLNTVIDLVTEVGKIDSMPAITGVVDVTDRDARLLGHVIVDAMPAITISAVQIKGDHDIVLPQNANAPYELFVNVYNWHDLIDSTVDYNPLEIEGNVKIEGSANNFFNQDPTSFDIIADVKGSLDILQQKTTSKELLTWINNFPATYDVLDRAARLLGIVYGNLGQLQQRASTYDLYVALRYSGSEIDPRSIRALTSADVVTVVQATPANLTATVTQAAKDRTISSVDATGTALQISLAALNGNSAALYTPAGGKAIRIKFISVEQDTDVTLGYRFGAAGTIYYLRLTKGLYISNLIGCNNQGAADAALYFNSSAATNVKGYVLYTEV